MFDKTKAIGIIEEDPSAVFNYIREGEFDFVGELLKKKKVDINTCDDAGNNILVRY